MANHTFGATSLVFGTPAVTGYIVQSHSTSSKAALMVSVQDEDGVVVHRRYDDVTTEVTFEAIFKGATIPEPGETFTVDTVTYEVQSVDVKRTNKDYQTVSIKGLTSEGI